MGDGAARALRGLARRSRLQTASPPPPHPPTTELNACLLHVKDVYGSDIVLIVTLWVSYGHG